jgi:hypothetical protein
MHGEARSDVLLGLVNREREVGHAHNARMLGQRVGDAVAEQIGRERRDVAAEQVGR